jgi:hypothetical protein
MSVQFEEDNLSIGNIPVPSVYDVPKDPYIVRLALKLSGGLLKDKKQANVVLGTLSVLILALSVYVTFKHTKYAYPSARDHEQEDLDYIKEYQASLHVQNPTN